MGASIKRGGKTRTELLPEEALYLLERGSLQIWDEEWGVSGAVEMSVMEGFSLLLGQDGLTWERYQAYAYLKRLGYTVQRTRRFLPAHFVPALRLDQHDARMAAFRTWWRNIPGWVAALARTAGRMLNRVYHALRRADLRTLVAGWRGSDYGTSACRRSSRSVPICPS
jgi:tRNA-splicing endonuclease subunit Sen54